LARKVSGRAAFLAHFKEIEAELATGQFASVVHGKFKDRLGFSYRQFAYYVREYELGPARPETSRPAPRQPAPPRLAAGSLPPGKALAPKMASGPIITRPAEKRFRFDPTDIDEGKLI
jgi:hypothetical protein